MNRSAHPVEKEDVMGYLDGELPVELAAAVAKHLDQCSECSALVAELRLVSQQMAAWQIDPSPARLAQRVTATVEERLREPVTRKEREGLFSGLKPRPPLLPRWVWPAAGAVGLVLFLFAISIPNLLRSRIGADRASQFARQARFSAGPESGMKDQEASYTSPLPAGPMIVRTAALTLVTKEFDKTRAAIEATVRQHGGYSAELTVAGQTGSARALTATFRLPADQLDVVLTELKKLARVEQESQSGEEVTHQYVDLVARLSNARNTEQRLVEVLRQRTGKVADILAVEREIARVREEIERMNAQAKNLENQVRFATLRLQLSEEYKAELEVTPSSTGTRLRNAMIEGYRSAVEGAVDLVLVTLRYGPSLLFWLLVFFWPARLVWRRLRT